jgi:hypothetical protein
MLVWLPHVVQAGVALGVLLNTILPTAIITLLLLSFMVLMLLQTANKVATGMGHFWENDQLCAGYQ